MQKVIGFYGAINFWGEFSNFYPSEFTVDGVQFHWSEQFIMYQKAMLFNDVETAQMILKVKDPLEAKRLGRRVYPFESDIWEERKEELVLPGLYAKFSQDTYLKRILLGTEDAILCECSPRDKIWGIGMGITNPDYKDPSKWKGKNFQGYLLMKVRSMLQQHQ